MKKERSFGQLKFLVVSVLTVFFVWSVWTAPTLAAEKPIKIGVCLARTGPFTGLSSTRN